MKMEAPRTWPNLARLISQLPGRVTRSNRVLTAFKKYGEFTDADVKEVLGSGLSPEIRVGELPISVWGSTPDTADHCMLNQIMINQFEQLMWLARNYGESLTAWSERAHRRREWEVLVARAGLSIEALILHEVVHWGDGHVKRHHKNPDKHLYQDGVARRAGFEDRGHQFVGAAYGKRFDWDKSKKTGLLFTAHDIPGWMGTFKKNGDWYIYDPLGRSGPAPIRPPALKKPNSRTPMKLH